MGSFIAAAAKSLQSCPTLCDHIDGSPPGSPIPGILQARTLEWVAISFSNAWKWKVKGKSFSRVRLLATPRTAAYQAPPSMGFSRQQYWSGVPLPSLGFIINPKFSVSLHNDFSQISILRVWFLIGELRSCMPHSMAQKNKKKVVRTVQELPHTPHPDTQFLQVSSFYHFCVLSPSLYASFRVVILINILHSYQLNFLNGNNISLKFQYFGCPMSW